MRSKAGCVSLAFFQNGEKKAFGSALLAHAFAEFKQRRLTQVGLAVDGDNPDAYRFYEGVGMYRLRQYDHYQKQLADGR